MLAATYAGHDQKKTVAFPDKMSRKQAAAYLTSLGTRLSEKTLANLASNNNAGKGPSFTRSGWRTLYYFKADLDAWHKGRTVKVDG